MRKILMGVAALCITLTAAAQEFKIDKLDGNTGVSVSAKGITKLSINLGRVTVEGYDGTDITFALRGSNPKEDERAVGLKAINSMGLEDNTGIGINLSRKDGLLEVRALKKMNPADIKIKVPKGLIVSYSCESQYHGKVLFSNMENEIEVSAVYNSIDLENVTGPVTVKTVHGHIDAVFSTNVKGPVSIVSIHGRVDVAMPVTIKANIKLSTSYGEIFASPEFKMEIEKEGDMQKWGGDRVNGKINGGGMMIDLRSDHGKIYFRKK